jgi:hypothetical protein
MNITEPAFDARAVLETDSELRSQFAYKVREFCKEQMFTRAQDKEAPKIRQILDILFWTSKISDKQITWVASYATKNNITINK